MCVLTLSFAAHVQARDFGQMGETFPIIEQDLLATIEARLKNLESSGKLAALEAQMRNQAIASVRRPKRVEGISAATRKRAWLFDPSTIVENDITDTTGNIIAARGQLPGGIAGGIRTGPNRTAHAQSGQRRGDQRFLPAAPPAQYSVLCHDGPALPLRNHRLTEPHRQGNGHYGIACLTLSPASHRRRRWPAGRRAHCRDARHAP